MKTIYSGIAALGIAFASSASAQTLNDLNDIGDMASGIYQIDDAEDNRCYLAVGNYSYGKSGRGYAGLSCENNFDWDNTRAIKKVMSIEIGDMATGTHDISVKGTDCKLLLGNYSYGQSGRGYAAMDCIFD